MAIHYWDAKITTMALDAKTGVIADASPRSVLMRPEAAYVDDAKPTREEPLEATARSGRTRIAW